MKSARLAAAQEAMRRRTPRPHRGRSPIPICEMAVARLAEEGHSIAHIAEIFGCHPRTLQRRFAESLQRGRLKVFASAKVQIWKEAKAGDRAALHLLGRKYLKYDL